MASKPAPKKAPPTAKAADKPAASSKAAGVAAPVHGVSKRIASYGIDRVAEQLSNGVTMTLIAAEIGVTVGKLSQWIASDEEHSARAREARIHAARIWDEKALDVIEQAADPFELQRARELAQHYRWRASKTAPKDYGDKIQAEHTGPNGGPAQFSLTVGYMHAQRREDDDEA